MPIVKDIQGSKVDLIVLYSGNDETVHLEDFDETEILKYLRVCKVQRSILDSNQLPVYGLEIWIIFRDLNNPSNSGSLMLADNSYGTTRNWSRYSILNAEEVKEKLKEILHFDLYFTDT